MVPLMSCYSYGGKVRSGPVRLDGNIRSIRQLKSNISTTFFFFFFYKYCTAAGVSLCTYTTATKSTWLLHILIVIGSTAPIKYHLKSYILTFTHSHTYINYSIHTNKYTFEQVSTFTLSLFLSCSREKKTHLMVTWLWWYGKIKCRGQRSVLHVSFKILAFIAQQAWSLNMG